MYSRMADKLSKGNNSGTFKNVSIDIGLIGMQGKATETRKIVILTKKQQHKTYQKTFKTSSVLIRLKCIWHLLAS